MIPSLYERIEYLYTTTPPTWTLLGNLTDTLSCVETSSINSEYELVMEYPANGRLASSLQMMRLIRTTQLFFIYRIVKNVSAHTLTIYARHISYLMSYNVAFPFSKSNCTPALFVSSANARQNIFTFNFELEQTANVNLMQTNVGPSTLRDYLLNPDYGVVAYFGGEWVFDNLNCTLKARKGDTKNITIKYGRDLIDAKQEESLENIITHIIPYAYVTSSLSASTTVTDHVYEQATERGTGSLSGGTNYTSRLTYPSRVETVSATPHLYVFTNNQDSAATGNFTVGSWFAGTPASYALPGADDLPFKHVAAVNILDDQTIDPTQIVTINAYVVSKSNETIYLTFGWVADDGHADYRQSRSVLNTYYYLELQSLAAHYDNLRALATKYVAAHPVTFPVDITVRSLPEFMSGVKLGDTITVEYPDYGISTQAEIMTMEYDVLREQIVSYTLGKGRTSFAETMLHQDNKIQRLDGLVTARNPLKGT